MEKDYPSEELISVEKEGEIVEVRSNSDASPNKPVNNTNKKQKQVVEHASSSSSEELPDLRRDEGEEGGECEGGGDGDDNTSPGNEPVDNECLDDDGVGANADDEEDEEVSFSIRGRREGRDRERDRGKKRSTSGSSTPRRFHRSSKRPRSHSRSRVLTERVLFFEQVWQGQSVDDDESHSHSHLSITRSHSSKDLDSEFSKEIDALEKRLEKQRQRFKSGDVFFEKVTLRHTPTSASHFTSRGGGDFLQESLSRSETHLNPSGHLQSRYKSYERIERIDDDDDDSDNGGEESITMSSQQKHSISKSPVYDELVAESRRGDGSTSSPSPGPALAAMVRSEAKSQTVPGSVSIRYEAAGSPSPTRSRTPDDASEFSASGSLGSRISSKLAKYEFLGVTADAISRSRTPSGGTSLSSLRSVSPRMGDSRGNLSQHYHSFDQQYGNRRLIVTTTTTTTQELKSVRMARSPSSGIESIASPTSDIATRPPFHQTAERLHEEPVSKTAMKSSASSASKILKGRSSSSSSTIQSPTSADGSESDDHGSFLSAGASSSGGGVGKYSDKSGMSDKSSSSPPLLTSSPSEWYSQYKSKVAHSPVGAMANIATGTISPVLAGRFESDVGMSAKSKAAHFDSHIAEIKGMYKRIKTILKCL